MALEINLTGKRAHVTGVSGKSGIALVEIYEVR